MLDRNESRAFVADLMKSLDKNYELDDEFFEACFERFDTDGNQVLTRDEMADFVK